MAKFRVRVNSGAWQDYNEPLPFNLDTVDAADLVEVQPVGDITSSAAALSVAKNSVAPAISGPLKVGQQRTASTGTWDGQVDTYEYQWTRDGEPILGANANTYTPVAADDETVNGCQVIAVNDAGDSEPAAATGSGTITYTKATAAAALPNRTYTQGTGTQTVDAAADFTGAVGGTWSVTGTGASIDQSGQVSITTSALRADSPVVVTYTNSGGAESSGFSVTVEEAVVTGTVPNQTAQLGALDLASDQGHQIVDDGGDPATGLTDAGTGTASGYTFDGANGRIRAASDGSLAGQDGNTIVLGNGAVVTLDVIPDAYTFTPDPAAAGQLAAIIAKGDATNSGKTAYGRPGKQLWVNSTLNNRAFTDLFTIRSLYPEDPMVWDIAVNDLVDPTNLMITETVLESIFVVGTHSPNATAFEVKGVMDNFHLTNNLLRGNNLEQVLAGRKTTDSLFRSGVAFPQASVGPGGLHIEDNLVQGFHRRTFNAIPGGDNPIRIKRNQIEDWCQDGFYFWEGFTDLEFEDNRFWKPLHTASNKYTVASVDTANDRLTLTEEHDFGVPGTGITINFLPESGALPGGPQVMKDYPAAVIDATTIEFDTLDLTSAGSDVVIWEEPVHGDCVQFAIGINQDFSRGVFRRLVVLNARPDGIDFIPPQSFFGEDNNYSGGQTPDTSHYNFLIEGFMIYTENAFGIGLALPYNTWAIGCTLVGPPDTIYNDLPRMNVLDHFGGTSAGNVYRDSIAGGFNVLNPLPAAALTTANNIEASPADYADIFVNPGVPSDIDDFLARFAIKSGSAADTASPKIGAAGTGYFDYDAHTAAHPSTPVLADIIAADLSTASGSFATSTTADLSVITNKAGGTLYLVASDSADRPSPQQMEAGLQADGTAGLFVASQAVSASGEQTATATGLDDGVATYLHAMQIDGAGNYSMVEASAAFAAVGAATAPAAFTSGDWLAETGDGPSEIDFTINSLSSDGGSTITDLEYSTDNGATWASLAGTTTGIYTVDQHSDGTTGTLGADTSYTTMIRAVNAVDSGPNSDPQPVTSGAFAAGPLFLDSYTSDTTANYAAAGTKTWNSAEEAMTYDPTGSFEGPSTEAIAVPQDASVTVTCQLRNNDPLGGSASQLDVLYGSTSGGEQYGTSSARINQATSGTITQTITVTGGTLYVTPRVRGDVGETFDVFEIRVDLAI